MAFKRDVAISSDHPALAGHFPGHPVVPGVVLVGEAMQAVREAVTETIECVGVPSVKFLLPLHPGQCLTIGWDHQEDGTTAFTCTAGTQLIANGILQYHIVPGESTGDS
jgi:3-hydroxymyristoyl/3-hydroxydecanoyl-(acyl carrier protein) dehydratase